MAEVVALNADILASVPQESRRIQPEEWAQFWPQIQVTLDTIPQFWADYWTKDSIFVAVMTGRWQAWGFGERSGTLNVVVLTQICDFPANRYLQFLLAFGNSLESCLPLIEATMERFAIEAECDVVEIAGRAGWERKLRRFRRTGVILKAEVPRREHYVH